MEEAHDEILACPHQQNEPGRSARATGPQNGSAAAPLASDVRTAGTGRCPRVASSSGVQEREVAVSRVAWPLAAAPPTCCPQDVECPSIVWTGDVR